tara:strand:- start:177 stop:470 length:294 start_codon:yes stop_codon:yes gene_type:complete
MKNKQNNNIINFSLYFSSILTITFFLLIYLTLKNECKNNRNAISDLRKQKISNSIIVKELQSKKENLLSEHSIIQKLSNKMVAVAPETLIISMDIEQ